jgi:protein O-GlcNAc transferase
MIWNHRTLPFRTHARIIALTTALILSLVLVTAQISIVRPFHNSYTATSSGSKALQLPPPYLSVERFDDTNNTCASQYDTGYIHNFVRSQTSYCDNASTASLTCFSSEAHNQRLDTFCVGGPADMSISEGSVTLPCKLRELSWDDHAKHSPKLADFTEYWYETGPKAVFDNFIHLDPREDDVSPGPRTVDNVLFLVKREETVNNLWHTLMQVMSLTLSLDVLRLTVDPGTGRPFLDDRDLRNSRVVILDQWEEGPFFELWSMFAALAPSRLGDNITLTSSKMIIPLPGGSNPMWEGDWVDIPCNESSLLRVFSERVLNYYNIPVQRPKRKQLTLTLIDRRSSRRLRDLEKYPPVLRQRFPDVKIELVDFAGLSLPAQIRLVRSTDLLVGVHGAGLTHALFLPKESVVVEILPPRVDYKGFANVAKLLGHHYYSRHGNDSKDPSDDSGNWYVDEVSIDEDDFLELVAEAITKARD